MNDKYIEYKSKNDPMLYFLTINKKLIKKFITGAIRTEFPNFVQQCNFNTDCFFSNKTLVTLSLNRIQEFYEEQHYLSF